MALVLVLLFVVAPLVELFVIIQVADWIGILEALALLVAVSVVGVYLVKREGIAVLRRIVTDRREGRVPAAAVFDAGLLAVAGVLLVLPGFVTDVIGLALLLPPVRAGARGYLRRRWLGRAPYRRLGGP